MIKRFFYDKILFTGGPFIMAKEKKPVHHVQMTEGKRNIIHQLLEEYDIQTAEDIQDALKDLLGGTIKEMMEAEMNQHLGYEKSERSNNDNYRNGYKHKQVNSSYGSMDIKVPQDRQSTFQPQIVKKRQKDIKKAEELEQKMREEARLQRIKDFNTAIRDKRKENITNFIDDKKDKISNVVDTLKNIKSGVVTSKSSFVVNVKNEVIDKVRENTTLDLKIQNAIENLKLKRAYREYDKAYEKNKQENEQYLIDKAVPFANINNLVSTARKEKCYLGRASKRAVLYVKNKVNNKSLDIGIKADLYAFAISSKISKSKSKLQTVFNNQLDKLNNRANDFVDRRLDAIKKDDGITSLERKDIINTLRTDKEKDLAIKRAQLESMREAMESINQSGDIFANATPLIATSKVK